MLGALLTTMATVGMVPSIASAGSGTPRRPELTVEYFTSNLNGGDHAALFVRAAGAKACRLSILTPEAKVALQSEVRPSRTHVQWRWRVPNAVRGGTYRGTVKCAASKKALAAADAPRVDASITVAGTGRSGLVRPHSLKVSYSKSRPGGKAGRTGGETTGRGAGKNPFTCSTANSWCISPEGQCTWWAYNQRPDIYDTAVAAGVPGGGEIGPDDYVWDARHWAENAKKAGIPTGTTPVTGAIVVFPAGYGGSSAGHVGFVEQVNPDGSYVISEHNWNGNQGTSNRLISPNVTGVEFIYGGPAGNGPAPVPPPEAAPAPAPSTPTYAHKVQGTCDDGECGLRKRPDHAFTNQQTVGVVYDGNALDIVCQAQGEPVTTSRGVTSTVWDKLTDNTWVSDLYVDTPNANQPSPPIPGC